MKHGVYFVCCKSYVFNVLSVTCASRVHAGFCVLVDLCLNNNGRHSWLYCITVFNMIIESAVKTQTLRCWFCILFYSAPVGVRSIVINPSVCLSVWLSVCLQAYLWNRLTDLHEILCSDPLWPWLGPPRVALRYVMYFRLYGMTLRLAVMGATPKGGGWAQRRRSMTRRYRGGVWCLWMLGSFCSFFFLFQILRSLPVLINKRDRLQTFKTVHKIISICSRLLFFVIRPTLLSFTGVFRSSEISGSCQQYTVNITLWNLL